MGLYEDSARAKEQFLELLKGGKSVKAACAAVERSHDWYKYTKKTDPGFALQAEMIINARRGKEVVQENISFEEFSKEYLHQDVFWHQQQWVDLIEGRTPRDLHESETFYRGRPDLLICNTPPEHAKTTTITVNYVTYRIALDPNIRVIVVSKTQEMAKRFVYAIKNRLTHPRYLKMQLRFGPVGGWASTADSWQANMVYLGQEQRDSGEKDPTLLALGMGGQIYGARADLIICDDCVTLSNAHEFEKQIDWLSQEVITRLEPKKGKLLVVGTRVAPEDLYKVLQEPNRYPEGRSPWTYLAQPAVLEFGDNPASWKTLWPQTNGPDGLETKWDGTALFRRRAIIPPRTWAMAYMQADVVEDAVFPQEDVRGCISGRRAGLMHESPKQNEINYGMRPEGMTGLYIVAGLDPAMAGHTAAVVMGVDRIRKHRYVLDVHNQQAMTPGSIRQLIRDWTTRYGIQEWRIEKNAFQAMLTQDEEINAFLAGRGCVLKEHHTGNNKWDIDFGVASMAPLFANSADKRNLISLPSTHKANGVKDLVEQLITWAPETKGKTDCVMALWFAEIRAREICNVQSGKYFRDNPYLTQRGREARVVINLDDYWRERQESAG